MNNDYNGIGLPTVVSLIKKLGGNGGGGVGGDYLPLSGGTMSGDVTFKNNLNINGQTVAGVPKNMVCLSNEDRFILGSEDVITHLYSEHRPYLHVDGTTQQIAYLSDVVPKASISIVETLPQSGETNVLYFVKDNVENVYAIFLWDDVNKIFVLAGDSNLVLNDYYTKTQTDNLFLAKTGGYMTGAIGLSNNTQLYGISTDGSNVGIAILNENNTIIIGSDTNKLHLRGNTRPEVKVGDKVEYMALLSDITSMGSDYLPLAGGTMADNETFNNNVGVYGTTTSGQTKRILMLNNANNLIVGEGTVPLQFSTSTRPKVNTTGGQQELAYLSDINSSGFGNYLPLTGGEMTGNITFNTGMLYGKSTEGELIPLVGVANGVNINVGGTTRPLMLQSSQRPSWNNGDAIHNIATLQDIDEKVGKDYRVISETLDLNGVVSTIATFDAPDIASVLADIKNYEITFNYSYTSADGKLIIENHLGVSDNNELMQINLDIPAEKNVINIKGHAVGSTISITNFVITCHIRPLNIDM